MPYTTTITFNSRSDQTSFWHALEFLKASGLNCAARENGPFHTTCPAEPDGTEGELELVDHPPGSLAALRAKNKLGGQ